MSQIKLSFVIVTYNRITPLLRTLRYLNQAVRLPRSQWELWLVDNASTDGTVEAVQSEFPWVNIINRSTNEGACARTYAFDHVKGEYTILLDDDSYPVGDTVTRSIAYLDAHPNTAAITGRVKRPDGTFEACALPVAPMASAVCVRNSVMREIGGFRTEFFIQAEEYDLSFRILQAGYDIARFDDLLYHHDKTSTTRSSDLILRMDLRNNLVLIEDYLPRHMRRIYRSDWLRRYIAFARQSGSLHVVAQGIAEARAWIHRDIAHNRRTLSANVLEMILQWDTQAQLIRDWAQSHNIKRVVIAEYGKNVYATFRGCKQAGLDIKAIADSHPAFVGMTYRDMLPIIPLETALDPTIDGIVLSNVNPAQIDVRLERISPQFDGPTLRLWNPQTRR